MDTQKFCSNCHVPLAADAPRGLCPACLMKVALATGTAAGPEKTAFELPSSAELEQKFPQLEILALIGRGGMGAVYKARQRELDRFVALKILPLGTGEDPAFAERFTREARALARLNHPGIVTIHDFGRADGLYFFIMEFVDGVNLRQLLAGGRVSPREALAIVPEICDALQFAHDHGIVHRDIKPENILLDRRGRVKVADFGLAKIMSANAPLPAASAEASSGEKPQTPVPLTEGNKVLGTPAYMAPEQMHHPDEVDHRADIYALGVVLYQMLTGELPGHRLEPPSKKIHIDVRLDEVVLRALERQPALRFQQAGEVKTQLETIATTLSEPITSPPQGGKLDQPSAFAPPAGPVELKLKWAPGLRFVEEMNVNQNMTIRQPGPAQPQKHDLSLAFQSRFAVLNETAGGGHEVELEFPGARMEMGMGSYLWRYDSTRSSTDDTSEVAQIFQKILAAKIRYFLNPDNQIERMEGAEELKDRLLFSGGVKLKPGAIWDQKQLEGMLKKMASGPQPSGQFSWLIGMFSKAWFESLIHHYFLPNRAVQPGDTWPVHHAYPVGAAHSLKRILLRDFTVTFRGWETHSKRVCARLEFQGTEKTQADPDSKIPSSATFNTEGTFSGVAWFDPDLGRVLEVNSSRDFQVISNKIVNPMTTPRAAFPLQTTTDDHHQVITEKLLSVE